MNRNHFRYQLYIKRSILQAHIAAIDNTIYEIESSARDKFPSLDDYRLNEEDCFDKYLTKIEDIE